MESSTQYKTDIKWMQKALELAAMGHGYVSPNPLVGCVIIDKDGKLIGKGYHERFGKAHAEVNAIESVKNRAALEGATVYVTLEPCAHHGKTPPCADLLASLPIRRVVIALEDPNPKVNGKGIQKLKEADIEVTSGILTAEAIKQNEVFLHHIKYGRPFITLKIAQTLDGYVAAPDGSSQWITGKEARKKVHEWRTIYDAVMVGRSTALLDNPRLTVRHVEGRQPQRIVIDGPGTLPSSLHLFTDQYSTKTWRISYNSLLKTETDPLLSILGGQAKTSEDLLLLVNKLEDHADLEDAFGQLYQKNIASILVEAGSNLASALLRAKLVDKLHLFIAPKLLGGGTRSVLGLGIDHIEQAQLLTETSWEQCGCDLLFTGYFK